VRAAGSNQTKITPEKICQLVGLVKKKSANRAQRKVGGGADESRQRQHALNLDMLTDLCG